MFTPIHTFVGGVLLHLSSASLLTNNGRVFGGSSILYEAIYGDHAVWRWTLLGGMLVASKINSLFPPLARLLQVHSPAPGILEPVAEIAWPVRKLVIAGLLVGFGSKLGSGCTSGHFLCGVSRLSPRSIIATVTFFAIAVVIAFLSTIAGSADDVLLGVVPSYTIAYPSSSELSLLLALPIALFTAHYLVSRITRKSSTNSLIALLSGYTFATGLQLSGMSHSIKVLRFLHLPIPGLFAPAAWDPSLFMVVLGGIVPNAIHYALHIKPVLEAGETAGNGKDGNTTSADVAKKRDTASSSSSAVKKDSASTLSSVPATFKYHLPTKAQMGKIDIRLIVGAAIFGLGWGMTGTCLLPSVVNAGSAVFGLTQPGAPLLFLTAVIAGLGLGGLV